MLITFDDGYRTVDDHAYPILRELGLEVQKAGVLELQAHTHAGHHLVKPS